MEYFEKESLLSQKKAIPSKNISADHFIIEKKIISKNNHVLYLSLVPHV